MKNISICFFMTFLSLSFALTSYANKVTIHGKVGTTTKTTTTTTKPDGTVVMTTTITIPCDNFFHMVCYTLEGPGPVLEPTSQIELTVDPDNNSGEYQVYSGYLQSIQQSSDGSLTVMSLSLD